jgi:uncharacterized protein (DUF427 family)
VSSPIRIKSKLDQESVWDYPRPPRLEPVLETLKVMFAGTVVAQTRSGYRVLETSHPPVYYIPRGDVVGEFIVKAPGSTYCEFKGRAEYWSLQVSGLLSKRAAWSYPAPTPAFRLIADHLAFYASRGAACWVGDERVKSQHGDFYGGWITERILGPFKGGPGTRGW